MATMPRAQITRIAREFAENADKTCPLSTLDAADEEDSVDLGGGGIIKKKNTTYRHH